VTVKPGPSALLSPVAAFITLAVAWAVARAGADLAAGDQIGAFWLLVVLPAPLLVAVAWGRAAWAETRSWRLAVSVVAWLAAGYLLLSAADTWQMTANVAAGLVAGAAWRRGWRPDVALAGVALVLAPLLIWAVVQMPVREQLAAITDQSLKMLEQQAPPGTDPAELAKAREIGRQRFAQLTDLTARLYPSLIGTGLLGQAVVILLLVRVTGRKLVTVPSPRRLPPFAQWRLPFYVVWALAVGIGLMITRKAPLADAGLNLSVLAAALLSVQGLSVQYHLSRRFLPPAGLVIYWTLMGLAFVPLVVTSVLLGLADQWRDLRRLDSGANDAGSQ
jgi:hypothetical protein